MKREKEAESLWINKNINVSDDVITNANTELSLCSQIVITSMICIPNWIPLIEGGKIIICKLVHQSERKKKKPRSGTDSRHFLFGTPDNLGD